MSKESILKLRNQFDQLQQTVPDDKVEFWFARDLQEPLGYAQWKNFISAIKRAIDSCKTAGFDPENHFRDITKKILN